MSDTSTGLPSTGLKPGTDRCLAVIGLGYVGLPLATAFAEIGLHVIGIDVDEARVAALRAGHSPIADVPSAKVAAVVNAGTFCPTTDYDALRDADAIFICVPTPFDAMRSPDLSYIKAASQSIASRLRPGQLVVLQSTTYPGTTEEVVLPILEQGSGLRAGMDFNLAFSPERIDPGPAHKEWTVTNTPKVVGGLTPACAERARALLARLGAPVHVVSSPRVAEMTKLLENIFRSVNIALVNELALLSERMGIDFWEVIEAAKTKPFGFMPFYPGAGVGGHCLAEDEFLFVKNDHGLLGVRIGEYFADLERQHPQAIRTIEGVTLLEPEGLSVLSFDLERQEACYKPIQAISRRRYQGTTIDITTIDRRSLCVTDGHPMIVWAGGAPRLKRAADLQVGDELILPTDWPDAGWECQEIDLIAYLTDDEIAKTRVAPKRARFKDHRDQLTLHLRILGANPYKIYRSNQMSLKLYLELERRGAMPIPRREIMLRTGRGPSWNSIAAVVTLNEDFARLVGYYLSEGCITKDKSLRTRFIFNVTEHEFIEDVCRILHSLGLRYSKRKDKVWNALHIKVSSNLFGRLIRDVLGCGTRPTEMQIPGILLYGPEPIRLSVLSGLLRGDGDVDLEQKVRHVYHTKKRKHYDHRRNAATIGYFSSSPRLFQQTVALIQGLGFVPTFKEGKPYWHIYGEEQLAHLTPLLGGVKRAELESYARNRRKRMPNKRFTANGSFATVKVREVKQRDGLHTVYSVEVEDTHTFITSYGILTHNCIPVDPYYLSWKAREYDFYTKFIELAAEVNQAMPFHVITRVADALNQRGRGLPGARILILGVAFKRDVDDARNSPAQRIIELLITRGAEVAYHDPFIPVFHVGDNVFLRQARRLTSVPLTAEMLAGQDCVVIVTGHSAIDYAWVVAHARLVVDTCNATARVPSGRDKIVRLGAPSPLVNSTSQYPDAR
ncbi:MAG: hypothetical protein C4311_15415 [Chloroflexota bacterium]